MTNKLTQTCISLIGLWTISAAAQTASPPPASTPPAAGAPAAPAAPAAAATAAAPAAAPAAPTSPVSTPAMAGPLAVNLKPMSFTLGFVGTVYVSGAVSGLAEAETAVVPGDKRKQVDLSNAQVFIQKVDGPIQFFTQVGTYSTPDLGSAYVRSGDLPDETWGLMPQAFVKIVPNSAVNIEVGKLPTLFGAEYTFTYENMNIERGLLWNQENAVARGAQINYTAGPVALSGAWTDGFYSGSWSWASFSAAWTIDGSNSLTAVAGGNVRTTTKNTFATPGFLNNEKLFNLLYTRTQGAWTINPYIQYTEVPTLSALGSTATGSTFGVGVLVNYTCDSKGPLNGFSLPFRVEQISSTGSPTDGAPNLLYGQGSAAWSATITPTYQYNLFFARIEASYVAATGTTPGDAFGAAGTTLNQTRFLFETGILF